MDHCSSKWVNLDTDKPIWDHFFTVAPLYVIGTCDEDGAPDLAPKHLALPLGWDNFFGFVCSPSHTTYRNVERDRTFTVSAPRPDQVVLASLSASPRCGDGSKPIVGALPIQPARQVSGPCLKDAYFCLECRVFRIIEGFGRNVLIIGEVIEARAHSDILIPRDTDPQDHVFAHPLLTYVAPGRFAEITKTNAFPFPKGYHK